MDLFTGVPLPGAVRTIDYRQAYYDCQKNAEERVKYIPNKLLAYIQEAEAAKSLVVQILFL